MTYQKQEWVDQETVITAARMDHIEEGIAAEASKSAVSYELNSLPSIPNGSGGSRNIPTGWAVVGSEIPAITYAPSSGSFQVNTPGVYLVALSGSYSNGPTSGTMEYRVDLNDTRILAVFGMGGDVSSRSGTCITTASAGDLFVPNYSQASGSSLTLRAGSFNTISFAQIG